MTITIRPAQVGDRSEWQRLRLALWPGDEADHAREIAAFFDNANPDLATFVIDRGNGHLGGFLEVQVRAYAEGCDSDRVGYLEGWYVAPDLRRQGWGRALVARAEAWGRQLGLTEMASDCELENRISAQAHAALGFQEVERIICFRKAL